MRLRKPSEMTAPDVRVGDMFPCIDREGVHHPQDTEVTLQGGHLARVTMVYDDVYYMVTKVNGTILTDMRAAGWRELLHHLRVLYVQGVAISDGRSCKASAYSTARAFAGSVQSHVAYVIGQSANGDDLLLLTNSGGVGWFPRADAEPVL